MLPWLVWHGGGFREGPLPLAGRPASVSRGSQCIALPAFCRGPGRELVTQGVVATSRAMWYGSLAGRPQLAAFGEGAAE